MTSRLFVFCFSLVALAGCASTSENKAAEIKAAGISATAAATSQQKKDQESRFIKDIYLALDEGKVATADALLISVLQVNPTSVEARLARGEIVLRQARYGLAMDSFGKLVKEAKLPARPVSPVSRQAATQRVMHRLEGPGRTKDAVA